MTKGEFAYYCRAPKIEGSIDLYPNRLQSRHRNYYWYSDYNRTPGVRCDLNMGDTNQKMCKLCKEIFGSPSLAYLHVWVMHSSVPNKKIYNEVVSAEPLKEGRVRFFQTTLDLLAKETLNLSQRGTDYQLYQDSYDFLMTWNRDAGTPPTIARLIARGYDSVRGVMEIYTRLGMARNEKAIWKAVEDDTMYIVRVLKVLFEYPKGLEALTELGRNAKYSESFLRLVVQIEKDPKYGPSMCGMNSNDVPSPKQTEEGNVFKQTLMQLSVKIAKLSDQLPESIFVIGVKLKNKDPVGSGSFADVYYGEHNGTLVAVKKLRTVTEQTEETRKDSRAFCREALTWKLLEHAHILPLCGVSRELFPGSLCMISPWLNYGNVLQYIKNVGFDANDVHRILFEIALGLSYLHDHEAHIVHGDLRGLNVLIDDELHARLSDFGLANFAVTGLLTGSTQVTSTVWMPPEAIDPQSLGLSSSDPIPASDIFSFAGVCWEVYNEHSPFVDLRQAQAKAAILRGQRPFREDSKLPIPTDLWALMTKCWQHDYRTRPTASTVAIECEKIMRTPHTVASLTKGKEKAHPLPPEGSKEPAKRARRPPNVAKDKSKSPQWPSRIVDDRVQVRPQTSKEDRERPKEPKPSAIDDERLRARTPSTSRAEPSSRRKGGRIVMPEPWSSMSYDMRPSQSRLPRVAFRLPSSSSSSSQASSASASNATDTSSGSETLTVSDTSSETISVSEDADSESTEVPDLSSQMSQMHVNQGHRGGYDTPRSHTPPHGGPYTVPYGTACSTGFAPSRRSPMPVPVPVPSRTPTPTAMSTPQLRRMGSFSYITPVAVAVQAPVLIPIIQPVPHRFVPVCDGSGICYDRSWCPIHNPNFTAPNQWSRGYTPRMQ